MQVHLTKASPAILIRVEVDKTEPDSVRWGVMSSNSGWYEYTDKRWEHSETETQHVLEHALSGVWAADAILFWLRNMAFEIGFRLKWDEAQGKGEIDRDKCHYQNISYFVDGVQVADRETVEAALAAGDEWHNLGNVILASGTVRATDPCYQKDTWCTQTFPALPGTWIAQCLTGPTDWHHRVKELRIRHKSVGEDIFADRAAFEKGGSAGVDSGQCGFFDEARYPTQDSEFEYEKGTFYGDCCERTLDKHRPGGGVIGAEFGVVTSSGFGDGGYPVFVLNNAQGQAIAAVLVFIGEDDEELDEDEDSADE